MGTPASRWEYRYMVYGLLNAHTLLVSKLDPIRPVRYEMKGYDSLMASYYDKYVLEYISFEEWKPDLEKFELPKGEWIFSTCRFGQELKRFSSFYSSDSWRCLRYQFF